MIAKDRLRKVSGLALCAVGIILLSWWIGAKIEAHFYQKQLAHRLETARTSGTGNPAGADSGGADSSVSEGAIARSREVVTTGLVGRLEIPRLDVSAMVTEGVDDQALGRGIGHVADTPLPGEPGNVGLAAHRDTYFSRLKDIAVGDRIRLVTPNGDFSYEVEWTQIVDPNRVDLLEATETPSLTLVTCYPFNWVGPAPKRFVVRCSYLGELAAPG